MDEHYSTTDNMRCDHPLQTYIEHRMSSIVIIVPDEADDVRSIGIFVFCSISMMVTWRFFLSDMTVIDVYFLYHEINYGGGFIVYQFPGCRKTYTIVSMYHLCCLNLASNILSVLYCVAATWGIVGKWLSQMAGLMRK